MTIQEWVINEMMEYFSLKNNTTYVHEPEN